MSTFKSTLLIIVLIIALLASLAGLIKLGMNYYELQESRESLNKELMQKDLDLGKAETKFGDAHKQVNELSKELQEAIQLRDEEATRYGVLEAKYKAAKRAVGKVVVVHSGPAIEFEVIDGAKVYPGLVYQAKTETSIAPIDKLEGSHSDSRLDAQFAFVPEVGQMQVPYFFDYKLHMRFKAQIVETKTNTGAVNWYVELHEIDEEGNQIGRMELEDFNVIVQDSRTSKMFWWAPHLDIGVLGGFDDSLGVRYGGNVGVSFMGYGLTENDLLFRFANVSLDLTQSPGIGIRPIQYNLGSVIPLLSNLWIGPHLGISLDRRYLLSLSIGAVL